MSAVVQRKPPPRLDRLVRDIEAAIASGDRAQQSDLVTRSADALVRRWSRLPVADKPGFDGLLAGLLRQVDCGARAAFAERLTPLRRAPPVTAGQLARDPSARVAGPLLEACPSFDEDGLRAIVAACGDAHRCAIARRPSLGAATSLALVRTGSPKVMAALLANPGAALPAEALPALMQAAARSEPVAIALGARPGLPAPDRARLVDLAGERARASLARDDLARDGAFDAAAAALLLTRVARTFAAPIAPERAGPFAGSAAIAGAALGPGPVSPARLEGWIEMRRIEDALAALARDAGLPVAVLIACHDAADPAALTAVASGLAHPWTVLKALLRARRGGLPAPDALGDAHRLHAAMSALSGRRLARYAAARLGLPAFVPAGGLSAGRDAAPSGRA